MIDQSALEDFKPVMAMLEKYEAGGARRHGFDRSMATSPSTLARLPRSPGGRTSDVNMAEPSGAVLACGHGAGTLLRCVVLS